MNSELAPTAEKFKTCKFPETSKTKFKAFQNINVSTKK